MAVGSDNVFPKLLTAVQASDPAAPSDGSWKIYSKAGGIYARSSNSVVGPFGAAGAGAAAELLAYKVDTTANNTVASATMADVDATNLAVAFNAPATGNVLVRLSATASAGTTANAFQTWGLRESTTNIAGAAGESIAVRADGVGGTDQYQGVTKVFVLTGISAGSHTYKWAWANSTGTGTMKANANSPAVMEVWALP